MRKLSKVEQEESSNQLTPIERGAGHNFWKIKMESGLDLPSLAGGQYVINISLCEARFSTHKALRDFSWRYSG